MSSPWRFESPRPAVIKTLRPPRRTLEVHFRDIVPRSAHCFAFRTDLSPFGTRTLRLVDSCSICESAPSQNREIALFPRQRARKAHADMSHVPGQIGDANLEKC